MNGRDEKVREGKGRKGSKPGREEMGEEGKRS